MEVLANGDAKAKPSDDEMVDRAARLLEDAPRPGERWVHMAGGLYDIVVCGLAEGTHRPTVVYRSIETGIVWIRDLEEFREVVTVASGIDGRPVPYRRFARRSDAPKAPHAFTAEAIGDRFEVGFVVNEGDGPRGVTSDTIDDLIRRAVEESVPTGDGDDRTDLEIAVSVVYATIPPGCEMTFRRAED